MKAVVVAGDVARDWRNGDKTEGRRTGMYWLWICRAAASYSSFQGSEEPLDRHELYELIHSMKYFN